MANSDTVLNELTNLIGNLRKQESEAKEALSSIQEQIRAVEVTLCLCRRGETVDGAPDAYDALLAELKDAKTKGKTQTDGLMLIASKDGSIKVRRAQRLMIEAGFISNPKNASSVLYTLISRTEKFEKVKPGEYKVVA